MVEGSKGGDSALTLAAFTGNSTTLSILLENGAYTDHQNGNGTTAVMRTVLVMCTMDYAIHLRLLPRNGHSDVYGACVWIVSAT
jgi:hypothetical protein